MQTKVTIVDYGLGNIFSVNRAFSYNNCLVEIASKPEQVKNADFLVLPGVGAFKKGMKELKDRDFIEPILTHAKEGKPLLGICLGMQLLFDSSEENGQTQGLGLIPGKVERIVPDLSIAKVPHIGWGRLNINQEHFAANHSVLKSLDNKFAYFVHSYHPLCQQNHLLAHTAYHGHTINAMVMKNNIIGCQFHPEKSGHFFLLFLKEIANVMQQELV
jgi:glutamine amidotransferase